MRGRSIANSAAILPKVNASQRNAEWRKGIASDAKCVACTAPTTSRYAQKPYLDHTFIHDFISKDIDRFKQLCRQYEVGAMYVFGSAGREDFDPVRSDIDLLVKVDEHDPSERGEKLLGLWDALEAYFGRKIDIRTESSLQNPYFRKQTEAAKKLIYDGRSAQVLV